MTIWLNRKPIKYLNRTKVEQSNVILIEAQALTKSARNLQKQERIRMKISNPFVFQPLTSSVVEGRLRALFENLRELVKMVIFDA